MPTEPKARAPRKRRVDSKEAAVEAMIAEQVLVIEPPATMEFTVAQHVAFQEVIGEFAKMDWTPHTIRIAALLARSLVLMEEAQDNVITDGFTSTNARGTEHMNPSVSALNIIASQVMTMRRTLALHATASAKTGDVGKRRAINRANADDSPEDDLIAVPSSPAQLRAVVG